MRSARNEWVWLLLSMALFSVVAFWIIVRNADTEPTQPPYTTYSAQPRGCRALFELLNEVGLPAVRYGGTEYNLPEGACLALITDNTEEVSNFHQLMLDSRAIQLWIEEGGILLLVTDPQSMMSSELVLDLDEAGDMYDIDLFEVPEPGDTSQADVEFRPPVQVAKDAGTGEEGMGMAYTREYRTGRRLKLEPPISLLWEGIDEIELAEPGYPTYRLDHALLVDQKLSQPVVMYEPRGAGAVYWLTTPELTTNLWIDRADNHRLLLNLFSMAAGGRDIVFFEKLHGYSEQRHNVGSLLVQTHGGRLLLALGLCCALAFAPLAVRPARAAPAPVPPRRHTAEMVYAQADLYARAGKYHLAAERLVSRLIKRLERSGALLQGASRRDLEDLLKRRSELDQRNHAIISRILSGVRISGTAELKRLASECADLIERLRRAGQG